MSSCIALGLPRSTTSRWSASLHIPQILSKPEGQVKSDFVRAISRLYTRRSCSSRQPCGPIGSFGYPDEVACWQHKCHRDWSQCAEALRRVLYTRSLGTSGTPVTGGAGPGAGNNAIWCPELVRHRPIGTQVAASGGPCPWLRSRHDSERFDASRAHPVAGCGHGGSGLGCVGAAWGDTTRTRR
jgi:hypothetical protein